MIRPSRCRRVSTEHTYWLRCFIRSAMKGQSVYWLGEGFKFLAKVRQHETESPALIAVYDQMQPRFLTLQTEVGSH